ncbi:MAG TPA: hypothetical protein PLJ38_09755, partial [bacterium]|nr:hypothetical protein [bacterium]
KDMIPEIRMKTKEERAVQNLINTRDKIVKCRSTLKNQLHTNYSLGKKHRVKRKIIDIGLY